MHQGPFSLYIAIYIAVAISISICPSIHLSIYPSIHLIYIYIVYLHQIINHSMYSEFKIKLPIYAYCMQ